MLRPVGVAFLLALAAAVSAASGQDSRQQELAEIRAEIDLLQERLGRLERRADSLVSELEHISLKLELQEKRVAEAAAARQLATEQSAAIEARVAELEERLTATRQVLKRRLAGLYRLGRHGYLRLFLALEEPGEALAGIRILRYLVRRDSRAIASYQEAGRRLMVEQQRLEAKRRESEEWLGRERERRQELVTLRRRHQVLLADAEEERQELTARTEALRDKERKLESLLEFLYGRTAEPLEGQPIQGFRGVLDWPVQGQVVVGFGPRLDPRYGTQVPHNGIDLDTEPGAEVRVVYPGRVVFAAPFPGYGPTAVVHHPGRVFSLYAGLRALRVETDDVLSLGSLIGEAAGRLYFEIRAENRPEDPTSWLR